MKLVRLLFIVSLLCFPLGELVRIPLAKDIFVKPLDVLVVITAICFVLRSLGKRTVPKSVLTKPTLLFIGIATMSLFLNSFSLTESQLLVSFMYLGRYIAYATMFWVVSSFDEKFRQRIRFTMVFVGISLVFLGFVQYVLYPNLGNLYYVGWDEHVNRIFSTFLDPNFFGAFLSLFFIFLLSFFLIAKNKQMKIGLGVCALIVASEVFLTFSRSAILMFLVGGSTFFFFQKKRMGTALIAIVIFLFAILAFTFKTSESTNVFRTASSLARFDSGKEAITIFSSQPIFGIGFNAYRYSVQKMQSNLPVGRNAVGIEQHGNSSTDTSLLFVLATTGIVGFGAYLYLLYSILKYSLVVVRKKNVWGLCVLSSLLSLIVGSLFINSLFYSLIMYWFWILLGLIEKE